MSSAWIKKARAEATTPDALLRQAIAESPHATRLLADGEALWTGRAAADFSFRVREMTGDGWMALGDAGGFIDPLFSTGVHIALVGGVRGAEAIDAALATPEVHGTSRDEVVRARFTELERTLRAGTETFITAVRSFYADKLQPYLFAADQRTYLRRAITSMLAGDVFRDERWLRDLRGRLDAMLDGRGPETTGSAEMAASPAEPQGPAIH
jgi:flavin-dependent dehydrogenase